MSEPFPEIVIPRIPVTYGEDASGPWMLGASIGIAVGTFIIVSTAAVILFFLTSRLERKRRTALEHRMSVGEEKACGFEDVESTAEYRSTCEIKKTAPPSPSSDKEPARKPSAEKRPPVKSETVSGTPGEAEKTTTRETAGE